MKEAIEEKVKTLIIEANSELEAHNFDKSKEICNQALELDSDDPNIYLILLLAEYKVTEIEDLKNCKFDYESEIYKNVRRCADRELNYELDKYLQDKSNINSVLYSCALNYLELLINKINEFWKKISDFFEDKQCYRKILIIIIDFYCDERFFRDEVKNLLGLEDSSKQKSNSYKVGKRVIPEDGVSNTSTTLFILPLLFQIVIFFIMNFDFYSDKYYFTCFCNLIITTLMYLIIFKNYKRIIPWKYLEKPRILSLLGRSLMHFALAIFMLITNYYLYLHSMKCLVNNYCIVGLFLGILGSVAVNYLYVNIYCFCKNVSLVFETIFTSHS